MFPTLGNIHHRKICFPERKTHITADMCFPGRERHITKVMCFPDRGTHITRKMCFPERVTHTTRNMQNIYFTGDMRFLVGEHISLGICVFPG